MLLMFLGFQLVVLYVDFKLDESYTPSKISIRAGDGFHNLKVNLLLNIGLYSSKILGCTSSSSQAHK